MVLTKLGGKVFNSKDELWAALQHGFASITGPEIKRLYDSMPRRMAAVLKARGGHTRY